MYTHKPVGSPTVQELPVNKNKVDSFIHPLCNTVLDMLCLENEGEVINYAICIEKLICPLDFKAGHLKKTQNKSQNTSQKATTKSVKPQITLEGATP